MSERRIGTTRLQQADGALVVHCPAGRAALPALMLALFGLACSIIAVAAFAGLVGKTGDATSAMLALAFAGVFVLPLLAIGALFIAVALWSACNALTVAANVSELRSERRLCGVLLSKRALPVSELSAIDSQREARFVGIFGGARYYRLIARTPSGHLVLADHLKAAAETEALRQLFISAIARPELDAQGRCEHRDDAAENAGEANDRDDASAPPSGS